MDDHQRAVQQAEGSASGRADDIASMLADRVGSRAGVRAVFGEPVERDGVTVIPVARVRWGFGGGGGRGGHAGEEGEGSGGGGGATASPAGYIEIAGGAATYRRIGHPRPAEMAIAGAMAAYVVMRGLRALLK